MCCCGSTTASSLAIFTLNNIILVVLPFKIILYADVNLMHLFHREFKCYKMVYKQSL